jgi:hypothetical protein
MMQVSDIVSKEEKTFISFFVVMSKSRKKNGCGLIQGFSSLSKYLEIGIVRYQVFLKGTQTN